MWRKGDIHTKSAGNMRSKVFIAILVASLCFLSSCSSAEKEGNKANSNQVPDLPVSSSSNTTVITDTTDPKPDTSQKDAASACVTEFFDADTISSLTVTEQKIEVKISYPGTSGEVVPDDWSAVCENFSAASNSLSEDFSESGIKNIILQLVDSEDTIMLTILNGKTSYSKYETFDYSDNPPTISLEEFNAIQTGMNLQEVTDIVGSPGTMISEVDLGMGYEYRTVMFQWDGEGSLGANANVTFQGGEVISKAQFGLE